MLHSAIDVVIKSRVLATKYAQHVFESDTARDGKSMMDYFFAGHHSFSCQ